MRITEEIKIDHPIRLDKYLKIKYPLLTQGIIEKEIRKSKIKVNQIKCKAKKRVQYPDKIQIPNYFSFYNKKEKNKFPINIIKLSKKILCIYKVYENDNILVINKPCLIASQKGTKTSFSISCALEYINYSQNTDFKIVHRLDKGTSGVMLIAKNRKTAVILSNFFKEQNIYKEYISINYGIPEKKLGTIESFSKDKKKLISNYKLLHFTKNNLSSILWTPKTGRKHQIRQHSKLLNCPIVGDIKYGSESKNIKSKHLFLHAYKIKLPNNYSSQKKEFTCQVPKHFFKFYKELNCDYKKIT